MQLRKITEDENLWDVDDRLIDQPGRKFDKNFRPLVEATVEQWGHFQFDSARLPNRMLEFVTRFVRMLGVQGSQYSTVKGICYQLLHRIEYDEPYFFLMDTRVQLSHGEYLHTYKHKKTGDILDPSRVEVFRLIRDWDYKPYTVVKNMIEHPGMQAFLTRGVMPPGFRDWDTAMTKLLEKISEVVWGPFGYTEHLVIDMMNNFEDGECYNDDAVRDIYDREELSAGLSGDYLFWLAASLGAMTWLKGPDALGFLTQYHIVYDRIFDLQDDGTLLLHPGTGDEVIVEGANVYTQRELEKIENRRPDTCTRCGSHVHCTKHVNISALKNNRCSCGIEVGPLDNEEDLAKTHGFRKSCQEYFNANPPRYGFLCQRCMFMTVQGMQEPIQCGRATCPATNCPAHQGEFQRLRALTQQRTRQLTSSPRP